MDSYPSANDAAEAPPLSNSSSDVKAGYKRALRKACNKTGFMLLGMEVITYAAAFLFSFLLNSFVKGAVNDAAYQMIHSFFSYSCVHLIAMPIIILLNNYKTDHKLGSYFKKPKVSSGFIVKWVIIGAGMTYITNIIMMALFNAIEQTGIRLYVPTDDAPLSFGTQIITVFFMAIAAPFMEEIFFRGSMLGNLRKHGDWFSIVMIAIFFGITHMNYQQIFFATTMGIIAGFVCVKAQSIWPGVFIHLTINTIAAIQYLLLNQVDISEILSSLNGYSPPPDKYGYFVAILTIGILVIALAITAVVLLCIELSKKNEPMRLENPVEVLTGAEKASVFLTSPGVLLFLTAAMVMTGLNASGFLQ